jgi:hypothetical protein
MNGIDWRGMLQQPSHMGPPQDIMRKLLMQQKRSGRLPVEALQNLGRPPQSRGFPNRAVGRFFDAGASRHGGLVGNPGGGFYNQYPDDPSQVGNTSQSPTPGIRFASETGTPGNPTGPGPGFTDYMDWMPPANPEEASRPDQNVGGGFQLLGYDSPQTRSVSGVDSLSALINPKQRPDNRMNTFRALAQHVQRYRAL